MHKNLKLMYSAIQNRINLLFTTWSFVLPMPDFLERFEIICYFISVQSEIDINQNDKNPLFNNNS